MLTMPTPYGAEFRQHVIDVARKGEAPLAQVAKDFGLSVTTLKRWLAIAERKDSVARPAASESDEVRELKSGAGYWNRRMRFCAGLPPIWPGTSTQIDSSTGSVNP
jgi:transposase